MVNHSNSHKSRYPQVLEILKEGQLRTTTEIRKELLLKKIDISVQGLGKHLAKMVSQKEAAFLDNTANNKELIKKIFCKNPNKKVKGNYIHTPLSAKLFKRLHSFIKPYQNQERYQKLIEKITDTYKALELVAYYGHYSLTNFKVVKEALRKKMDKGQVITGVTVQRHIEANKANIESYTENIPKLRIIFNEIVVGNVKYCVIGDELVPIQKFVHFLGLLEMTPYMSAVAYGMEQNRKEHTAPIIEAMKELFVMIVTDSQVRV